MPLSFLICPWISPDGIHTRPKCIGSFWHRPRVRSCCRMLLTWGHQRWHDSYLHTFASVMLYRCERSDIHTHRHTFTLFKDKAGYTEYRRMNPIFCAWVWQGNLVICCAYVMILKQLECRTSGIVWEACQKMEANASEKASALADLEASFCRTDCIGVCYSRIQ